MTLEQFLSQYGLIARFPARAPSKARCQPDSAPGCWPIALGVLSLHKPSSSRGQRPGELSVGDCAWYFLGTSTGSCPSSRHRDLPPGRSPWIERVASRLGSWQLLLARVVYGTRNASMVFWGQAHLPFQRFALTDLLGCFLASTGFALLGYLTSQGVELASWDDGKATRGRVADRAGRGGSGHRLHDLGGEAGRATTPNPRTPGRPGWLTACHPANLQPWPKHDQVAALPGWGMCRCWPGRSLRSRMAAPGFRGALLSAIHPTLGHARRIGITGPPGAGKSTLTERLVRGVAGQREYRSCGRG